MAYVSTAKASPTPLPVLACESLYPNMWHQILNFFFLKISMAPLFFQYNFYFINMWFLDGVMGEGRPKFLEFFEPLFFVFYLINET